MLTRDRELLKFRGITHGCYVHALKPAQQFGEIVSRLDLARSVRPFTLCLDCNAPLRAIDKAQVIERLPPSVRANHERFTTCDPCGRVFWEGSHWQRLRELVDTAVQAGTKGLPDGDRQLAASLRDHVFHLAAEIGERNVGHFEALRAAAAYIRSEWQELGYAVDSQTYPVGEHVCENLEIAIPGADKADEIILAGAHYDTVSGSPGADDNASAVAALIELARMLRGATLRRSVKLVAFVNRRAAFFLFRRDGQPHLCTRGARTRRRHQADACAGNAGLLQRGTRKPALSTLPAPFLSRPRQLHRLRCKPTLAAATATGGSRLPGLIFFSLRVPGRACRSFRAWHGATTCRSGAPDIPQSWSRIRRSTVTRTTIPASIPRRNWTMSKWPRW